MDRGAVGAYCGMPECGGGGGGTAEYGDGIVGVVQEKGAAADTAGTPVV